MPQCSNSSENALIAIVVLLILLNIVLFLIIALLYNYIKVTQRNFQIKDQAGKGKPKALIQRIPVVSRCSVFQQPSEDLYYEDDKAEGKTQSSAINNDEDEPVVGSWTPPVKNTVLELQTDGKPKPQGKTHQDSVDCWAQQQAVKNSYDDEPVRKPYVAPKKTSGKQRQNTDSEEKQRKQANYDHPVFNPRTVSKTESEQQLTYEDVTGNGIDKENEGIDEAIYDNEENPSTLPRKTGNTHDAYVLGDQPEDDYIDSKSKKRSATDAKRDTYDTNQPEKSNYLTMSDSTRKYQNMQQKQKTDSEYANQTDSDDDEYVNVKSIKRPADKKQYINVNRTSENDSSTQEVYLELDSDNKEQEVYQNVEEDQEVYTNVQDQNIYDSTD